MEQLTITKPICVQDILDNPVEFKDAYKHSLVKNLDENGLFVFYRVDAEGETSTSKTFTSSIDWLRKYTQDNRLDIARRALEIGISNLAKKIKESYPNQDNVIVLYDSFICKYQAIDMGDRDQLIFSVEICEEDNV